VSEEAHGPRSEHAADWRDPGPIAPGVRRAPSSLEATLGIFRDAAVACLASDDALPAARAAIARIADLGRSDGIQPEELIVSLKRIYNSLPFDQAAVDQREALKRQFVTCLIEAYFGGRAD